MTLYFYSQCLVIHDHFTLVELFLFRFPIPYCSHTIATKLKCKFLFCQQLFWKDRSETFDWCIQCLTAQHSKHTVIVASLHSSFTYYSWLVAWPNLTITIKHCVRNINVLQTWCLQVIVKSSKPPNVYYLKKYDSASYLGIGRVQNACLYVRRSNGSFPLWLQDMRTGSNLFAKMLYCET